MKFISKLVDPDSTIQVKNGKCTTKRIHRCPNLSCRKIVETDFKWCPYCKQRLRFFHGPNIKIIHPKPPVQSTLND